jgi:hypothetical protein
VPGSFELVTRQRRIEAFGGAGAIAVAGVLCGVLVPGETGELLVIALLSIGLGGIVLLVFLEVGLSEDRERARDEAQRRREAARREQPEARERQAAGRPGARWRRTRPRRPG